MTGRVPDVAAVSALATLLTLVVAAPVIRAPSDRIFGMEITGRHRDPFTAMEQFGAPMALGVYSQPLTDVPGALLARAFGPVAAYNGLVLVTFPLSAAAAYCLARQVRLSPACAAIVGILFAFSPFHLAHAAYHPHIAQTQWVPLYFLALWRCLDDPARRSVGFLAVSAAGVTLSNFYGGLIAAILTPAAMVVYWLFEGGGVPRSPRRLATTLASLVVIAGAGVAYAWSVARDVVVDRAAFAFPRADLFRYSAKWWSYLVPPVEHPVLGGIAGRVWSAEGVDAGLLEQQVSLGWGLVALGLVALFAWWSREGYPASLRSVPVLVILAAVALVCSLSPERTIGPFTLTRPSALLYRVVPMFRAYARFGLVVQLMAALLAGIGAEHLWRSGARRARIACVALLALTAGEYAVWPPALWRDVLPTTAHRWVARQPGPVRVLDCALLAADSESVEWLTGHRIALSRGASDDCLEPDLAGRLSAGGYTHVLVRRGTPEGRWFASHDAPPGLPVVARFADGDVFAVRGGAPPVYTERMRDFYPRETDEAWTWRWMGPRASWTVVNKSDRTIVACVDVELAAFHGARHLVVLLDGSEVQTLMVEEGRRAHRIGPLALRPGDHALVFHPVEPPTLADDVLKNGDGRALSFGFGTWRWAVEGGRP